MKQVTTFHLEHCLFAIESTYVNSILPMGKMLRIPQKEEQPFNRTMMLDDGRFIHVINTEKLLGLAHAPIEERTRVIVLQSENPIMGIVVDEVSNVVEFDNKSAREILPISKINGEFLSGTLTGAKGEIVLLINMKALMDALT